MKELVKINGSLSCVDLLNLQKSIEEINNSKIDGLHYDVVDGKFNECFVFGDLILEKVRPLTKKPIAVHLACVDVEPYIRPMIKAGADYLCIHYESDCDLHSIFNQIRELGAKPVLAFRSDTPVPDDFEEYAKEAEWILKLTVNPGFAGQQIQEGALEHIREMSERLKKADINKPIEADGNINVLTIPKVVVAGASILTGGTSGLFNDKGTVNENYERMKEACKNG